MNGEVYIIIIVFKIIIVGIIFKIIRVWIVFFISIFFNLTYIRDWHCLFLKKYQPWQAM